MLILTILFSIAVIAGLYTFLQEPKGFSTNYHRYGRVEGAIGAFMAVLVVEMLIAWFVFEILDLF